MFEIASGLRERRVTGLGSKACLCAIVAVAEYVSLDDFKPLTYSFMPCFYSSNMVFTMSRYISRLFCRISGVPVAVGQLLRVTIK